MISVIVETTLLYWATALDLLLVLALLFAKFSHQVHRQIQLGQLVGSLALVAISLLLAFVFHFVPEDWILGFLGLIPLFFGFKYLFFGDDDEEEVEETLEKRRGKNLFLTVVLLSFASCGADNVGLFTPYLVTLRGGRLLSAVMTFVVNIILLGLLGHRLAHLGWLKNGLERYSRWIMAIVYIGLGLMIFIEAGTLQHFLG